MTAERRTASDPRRTLAEPASIDAYPRLRRATASEIPMAADRPRPLEFDDMGFPIAQRSGSYSERVARLLGS